MNSVPECRQRSCLLLQVYTYAQRPKGRTREQIDIAVDAFARLSIGNVLSASGTKPIVQPLPVVSALLLFCNLCIEPKYESDSEKSFCDIPLAGIKDGEPIPEEDQQLLVSIVSEAFNDIEEARESAEKSVTNAARAERRTRNA